MANTTKRPRLWGIHADPGRWLSLFLGGIMFFALIAWYSDTSQQRLAENEADKLTPSISKMAETTHRLMTEPSRRTGELVFWEDTKASLKRIGIGLSLSALIGSFIGISMGLFPAIRATLSPIIVFFSNTPPVAVLVILLVIMGTGESAKIGLIFIGTVFLITRDIQRATEAIPNNQITKSLTLGLNQFELMFRVVLPQIIPALIEVVRLMLGASWIFLIAAEQVAASSGLGYRIFLVRRYMSMDTIYPYVIWITLLAFGGDLIFRMILRYGFPWYKPASR